MKLIDTLEIITSISNVPVTYLEEEKEKFQSPNYPYLTRLVDAVVRKNINFNQNVECVLARDILGYGLLRIKDTGGLLIIGPITIIDLDTLRAQYILKSFGISTTETNLLLSHFKSIPTYSLQKFANLISLTAQLINGEEINIKSLLPVEFRYSSGSVAVEAIVEEVLHDGQSYENKLYSLVELGQAENLKKLQQTALGTVAQGTLASDPFRHFKYLCICSTALAARHAVNGGLNYNVAMTIADGYIQKIDFAPTNQAVGILHGNMLLTFAKRVAESKMNYSISSVAYKVKNYIDKHITEKITSAEIADNIKISRTYLSTRFKKETGKNLCDFITEQKIDEAKILLRMSSDSAVAISNALSFSSQSYFQSNFKKIVGMTPKQYRKKHLENYSI